MLTVKIKPALLKQNINNLGLGFKEANDLKKTLATNNPTALNLVKQLEKSQTDFISKKVTSGILGWVNDPLDDRRILVERGTGLAILSLDGQPVYGLSKIQMPDNTFPEEKFIRILLSKKSEDLIEWPYRDSTGNVTIGVGKKISKWEDFKTIHEDLENGIRFTLKNGGEPTDYDFQTAYDKVINYKKDAKKGVLADVFETVTTLRVSKEAGKILAQRHLQTDVLGFLNRNYPDFSTYPVTAQMAIADIVYNVGSGNYDKSWPQFKQALRYRDFATAAGTSSRAKISSERNTQTENWLKEAAPETDYFLTTDSTKRTKAKQIKGDFSGLVDVSAPRGITERFTV